MHTVNHQLFSDNYFEHGYTVLLLVGIFSALYVGLSILFQQRNIEAVLRSQRKWMGVVVLTGSVAALSLLLNPWIELRMLSLMSAVAFAAEQWVVIKWLFVGVNAVSLFIGMMLCFHADTLASMETAMGQWIGVRRHAEMMGKAHSN